MKVDARYDRVVKVYLFSAKKRYEGIPLFDEKEV